MASHLNVIVDLSHHNGHIDLAQAKTAGIAAVIHKSTQGTFFVDPMYQTNRAKAQQAGLLWGAYHFGVAGDGTEQADYFLHIVKPGPQDLLVLDFEANGQGSSMTLEEARAFVIRINLALGRFPGLYSGNYIKELLGSHTDPVLAKCWFWLSQYHPTPIVPVNWRTWTMWQYTNGTNGPPPYEVPGIGRCDRDQLNGDMNGLHKLWGAPISNPSTPSLVPNPEVVK